MNKKKSDLIDIFSVTFFLAMTFFIFGPLQLYFTNITELYFTLGDIWWLCILIAIAVIIIVMGIGILLRGRYKEFYIAFISGVALSLYLQGNYINVDYGTLNGESIAWGDYTNVAIWNTLIWILCLIAPFVLMKVTAKWKIFLRYISFGIATVQVVTLVILGTMTYMSTDKAENNYTLTNQNMFTLSANENIIVFVLDCYDSRVFNDFLNENVEYKDMVWSDFTYYPDTVGGATRTILALPYILTGQPYVTENTYAEYLERSFANAPLYSALEENGYSIGIYTNSSFVPSSMEEKLTNMGSSSKEVVSYSKLAYYLYRMTACSYFPHILKESVWMYTSDFDAAADNSGGEEASYLINDALFYKSLNEGGLNIDEENNAFRLYHLMGAHPPYTLDSQSQRISEGTSLEEQQHGVMNILANYFEDMKELGIYENATIIVCADHGSIEKGQNPMLLIKRADSISHFTVSDIPVSYANLHPTLLSILGNNEPGVKSIFELDNEDNIERYFYAQQGAGNESSAVEYIIRGKAFDETAISETGNQFAIFSNESSDYVLGTELYFDARATGTPYIVSGFRGQEQDLIWTNAEEAVLSFKLKDPIKEDVFVSIVLNRVITRPQRVGVYINGIELNYYKIDDENELKFIIPKELIKDNTLEIILKLLDATYPSELSATATDNELLGLAFYSVTLDKLQKDDVETPVIELTDENSIDFTENGNSHAMVVKGWHEQEKNHRWTADVATLSIPTYVESGQSMELTYWSYAGSGSTKIYCNGELIGVLEHAMTKQTVTVSLPETSLNQGKIQTIMFVTEDAVAPSEVGESADSRVLGIAVESIRIIKE